MEIILSKAGSKPKNYRINTDDNGKIVVDDDGRVATVPRTADEDENRRTVESLIHLKLIRGYQIAVAPPELWTRVFMWVLIGGEDDLKEAMRQTPRVADWKTIKAKATIVQFASSALTPCLVWLQSMGLASCCEIKGSDQIPASLPVTRKAISENASSYPEMVSVWARMKGLLPKPARVNVPQGAFL